MSLTNVPFTLLKYPSVLVRVVDPVTITPDLTAHTKYVAVLQTVSSASFLPPTDPTKADALEIVVRNSSGGAITITFDATYKTSGYVDPADGFFTSARFIYDAVDDVWLQVGMWSSDIPV